MNDRTTNLFALPEHLTAKAAPALISDNEKRFAANRYVAMTRATQRLIILTGP